MNLAETLYAGIIQGIMQRHALTANQLTKPGAVVEHAMTQLDALIPQARVIADRCERLAKAMPSSTSSQPTAATPAPRQPPPPPLPSPQQTGVDNGQSANEWFAATPRR